MGLIEPGTITAAFSASAPPLESIDLNGNFIGFDPDTIRAIAEDLGLKVKLVNLKSDGLIPGINSRRFDVALSGLTDNKKREQAVDFVNYARVGTTFIVPAGNPKKIRTLDDLCGLAVASATGDAATMYASEQASKCAAQGRPALVNNAYTEAAQAMLRLEGGNADIIA